MSTEHYQVVLFGIEPEQLVSYQSQNMGLFSKYKRLNPGNILSINLLFFHYSFLLLLIQ